LVAEWCETQGNKSNHIVIIDAHSEGRTNLPPVIGGYRPDLVWLNRSSEYCFIGEAKTKNDLRNDHTRKQLSSFLTILEKQDRGMLVVAVPWGLEGSARALIRNLQRELRQLTKRWTVISNAPKSQPPRMDRCLN
jgi:hypothetical protein